MKKLYSVGIILPKARQLLDTSEWKICSIYRYASSVWKSSSTVRNISIVSFGDAISKVLAVASALMLIRGLTQADYAQYIAFTSLATLLSSLVGNGMNDALVRFSAGYLSQTGQRAYPIYAVTVIIEFALYLVLLIFSVIAPTKSSLLIFGKPEFEKVVFVGILFGLGNLLIEIGRSILQAEEKFKLYVATLWVRYGLIFLSLVVLWISDRMEFGKVAWLLAFTQLGLGLCIAGYGILGIQSIHMRSLKIAVIRDFLFASGWLMGYHTIIAAFSRIDVLMLARFCSRAELAGYGVAYQYYSLGLLLLSSISVVLRPKFSKVEMQDTNRQIMFLVRWLRFTALFGIPVMLFIFFGKPIFIRINGIQYGNAFVTLAVFAVGAWLSLMLSPLINILMSHKRFRTIFFLAIIAFSSGSLFTYWSVRIWCSLGAAISVVFAHNVLLQIPILLIIIRKLQYQNNPS